jgi:dipeptidyl aminopeptidase/acylaminoacyl peptidase
VISRRDLVAVPLQLTLALSPIARVLAADRSGDVRPTGRARRLLTVADAIETTRVMPGAGSSDLWEVLAADGTSRGEAEEVLLSPDGMRYAVMLVRGDLERNGNWMELISGELRSYESALECRSVVSLFTTSLGAESHFGYSALTFEQLNPIYWLHDSARVAFFYGDGSSTIQAVAVNVISGEVSRLTNHPTDVVSFAVSKDDAVIYAARLPKGSGNSQALLRHGFSVGNLDLMSLIRGEIDDLSAIDSSWGSERFLLTKSGGGPRKIQVNSRGRDRWISLFETAFLNDGRSAVIDGSPEDIPASWDSYCRAGSPLENGIREARRDVAGPRASQLKQLFVVDLAANTARPLWNAPNIAMSAVVSPRGRSLVVGPTYLPVDEADSDGLCGRAIAEVDVDSGTFVRLPVPPDMTEQGVSINWLENGVLSVSDGRKTLYLQKVEGEWRPAGSPGPRARRSAALRVEIRQNLNSPPALHVVETAGSREALVADFNPTLRSDFKLGRVQHVQWNDPDGRSWSGLLYYPVNYGAGKRFPLVIQTHGHAPTNAFSLYGTGPGSLTVGLGPSYSVFAAQPLAARDIAVLQIEDKQIAEITESPREPRMYMSAYESAIRKFESSGLVDARKVGIVGFSRTGWHVLYALTHSSFPYAAAIVSDNLDGSYVQSCLWWQQEFANDNGATPFGQGLATWLKECPGFNADSIYTPLRLQRESGGLPALLSSWEIFGRLRRLGRPVELYVVPDIQHGSHQLQNPMQCLASQQGAVDWFDFWLNGREDSNPSKAQQFGRWRELRSARDKTMPAERLG